MKNLSKRNKTLLGVAGVVVALVVIVAIVFAVQGGSLSGANIIEITPSNPTILLRQEVTLSAHTILNNCKWSSSNTAIAIVRAQDNRVAYVTGLAVGSTTIKVKCGAGVTTGTTTVRVTAPPTPTPVPTPTPTPAPPVISGGSGWTVYAATGSNHRADANQNVYWTATCDNASTVINLNPSPSNTTYVFVTARSDSPATRCTLKAESRNTGLSSTVDFFVQVRP